MAFDNWQMLKPQIGPVTTPGPLLGPVNQTGPDGIQMEVPYQFKQVGLLLTKEGLVATLEEMAALPVPPIECHRVASQKPLHEVRKPLLPSLDQEMKVVGHQDKRIHANIAVLMECGEGLEKPAVVLGVAEHDLSVVPARDDVVEGTRKFHTRLAGHGLHTRMIKEADRTATPASCQGKFSIFQA